MQPYRDGQEPRRLYVGTNAHVLCQGKTVVPQVLENEQSPQPPPSGSDHG